jgi:hypothetical protein
MKKENHIDNYPREKQSNEKPMSTKYCLKLQDENFWIQKRSNAYKIALLKENYKLQKKQFLLCNLGIPKNIKHTKFYSLQINANQQEQIRNPTFKIHFCMNKLVNTKYNRIFNLNESKAVIMRIQKWSDEACLNMMKQKFYK